MSDPSTLRSWHDSWSALRVTVLGLDEDGFAVCDTLQELGATVTVVTDDPSSDHAAILGVLGVEVRDTGNPPETAGDLIIVSPAGESLSEAGELPDGVPVWSDVEFAHRVADKHGHAPTVVLVAGSGAHLLIARFAVEFLRRGGQKAFWGGHQAGVVLDALRDPGGWDTIVWVLDPARVQRLAGDPHTARHPDVVVCVDDTWDVELPTLAELYRNTEAFCIYRRGGGRSEQAVEEAEVIEGARAIGIGLDSPPVSDLGIVDGVVCDRAFLEDRRHTALELTTLQELTGSGISRPDDVLALLTAAAIARSQGVDPETIGSAISSWANAGS